MADSATFHGQVSRLRLLIGTCYIPKEREGKPQGDDAHFVSEEKQTFGIADGVGGWSKQGIDAGEFARQLMHYSESVVKTEKLGLVDLEKVLKVAFSNTNARGSTTACLITLKDQKLNALNIGDSGFRVLRDGECIYRSKVMQKSHNCPYQLGKEPGSDDPSLGQAIEVAVEDGDVVVAGTDGLFDNMYDADIEKVVKDGCREGQSVADIAWKIAGLAFGNSFDPGLISPYRFESQMMGGKPDDITVVVAKVVMRGIIA
ncbi:protein-serine/threonine phosphatase [Ranunculus cassubicifolius]